MPALSPNALLKRSRRFLEQAKRVVQLTKIEKLLLPLGRVHFVGSYRLDLMMRRDIDIIVLSNRLSKKKALAVDKDIRDTKKFSSVRMIDDLKKKKPYVYWELIVKRPEGEWKFDVTYTTPKVDISVKPIKKWLPLITPERRKLILQVKYKYLKDSMLYSHKLYGAKIYKAILERGVKDLKAFHGRVATPRKRA